MTTMTTSTATAIDRGDLGASLPTEALVLGVEDDRIRVRPVTGAAGAPGELRARVAVPGYVPAEGDRVLVQRAADGAVYILGVVHAGRGPSIVTPAGASASIEGEVLALRDAGGRLVLTLDGRTGELSIVAGKDLRLSAPEGQVVVEARALTLSVGHYELNAERILSRTVDAFHTATGVLETRAKHARTLVSRTFELLSRRTTIASEEDTRINGKRVLLG
jgi:hypothetical protein